MGNRIIGILAHVDAGKTTLTEAMLYISGARRTLGRVDHRDTFLDTDAIERDRGITIFSKQARFRCGDMDVTLLDTPGHVDFSAETERTLQVLDYAVLVVSGTDGVQGHTRTLFRLLLRYRVPVFIFVNKMDLAGADRARVLLQLKKELAANCVDFSAAGAAGFSGAGGAAAGAPGGGTGGAGEGRKGEDAAALYEELAMCSDELLEEYSETGRVSAEAVRKALAERTVYPVLFGSALKTEGVRELLETIRGCTPDDPPPRHAGEPESPFGARVYKIGRDAQGNRLTYLKVTGGSLKVKDTVSYRPHGKGVAAGESAGQAAAGGRSGSPAEHTDGGAEITEKVDQIRLYSGEKYELAGEVRRGEICAVTGLTQVMPGDGIGAETGAWHPSLEPVMTRAMLLPPDVQAQTFYPKLHELAEEDPALHLIWDAKAGEIRARVMGEVQIEVLTRMIRERYGVEVHFGPETVLLRETIAAPVIGIGHFEPLRHYAEVQLLLEPGERGSGIEVTSVCSEDVLDLNWQRLILTHVLEKEHSGVLTGSPVTDLKITLLTGRAHLKHTEGGDFREATYRAIRQGLMSAVSVLLEPQYHFVLDVPVGMLGRALSDLSRMRADAGAPVLGEERARIEGTVPVSQMASYVTEVTAYTKGTGSLSLVSAGYAVCADAEKVLAELSYDPLADAENPAGSVFCAHGAGYLVPWDAVPSMAHCEVPKGALARVRDILEKNGLIAARDEETGFQAAALRKRAESAAPGGEDAELSEIYRREFHMDRDGIRMDGEKRRDTRGGRKYGQKTERYPEIHQKYDKQGKPIYPKKDERGEYLIVDGYNIIYQWEDLRELAGASVDAARGKLLDLLSNYQGYTGVKLTVVFDAYRTEHTPAVVSQHQNVQVVFTRKGQTADAWIEREVHESAGKYKITVATSDALEQLTVMRLGALRMSARMLAEEMRRVCG